MKTRRATNGRGLFYTRDSAGDFLFGLVNRVLSEGYRTRELYQPGDKLVSTTEMRDVLIEKIHLEWPHPGKNG